MESKRRTQAERSAATTAALVDAARGLFSQRGYADVGTPEIAAAAGVTRGALYHQFSDKAALFGAVAEAVESDVTRRLGEFVAASGASDPAAALHAAVDGWLEACEEPEVRQVLLLDGPVVLGWDGFRDMALRHGLGLTEAMLQAAIDAGQLAPQPHPGPCPRADRGARRGGDVRRDGRATARRPATRSRAHCTPCSTGCSVGPQLPAVEPGPGRRTRAGAGSAGTRGRGGRRRAAGPAPRWTPPRRRRARGARRTPGPRGPARPRG